MNIINELKKLKIGKIINDVNLKKYTTYKLNEQAFGIAFPDSIESLIILLRFLKKNDIKHKIIGNGSNLIFTDYYDGILVKLEEINHLEINDETVTVGAGYNLIKLAYKVADLGLSGLEFATGIPGTIGGAIYMNAGAYKSDMGYIVKNVTILTPDLEIITMQNKDMDFHYRTSFLMKNSNYICLETSMILEKKDKLEIMEIINDRKKRRLESQPLEYPSAGSVFRNPEGDFAGRLIEAIGYKGKVLNDVAVSEKHANFIVNMGNATGKDIKKLILEIKAKVKNEYGIDLKVEQEFVE
ncbi:MAG: UDP-N-acetylmuramate dehydrogenase [Bacilli bacterium]